MGEHRAASPSSPNGNRLANNNVTRDLRRVVYHLTAGRLNPTLLGKTAYSTAFGMRNLCVFASTILIAFCVASENTFSVNDDLFAFPQHEIQFSNSFVLKSDALVYLGAKGKKAAGEPSSSQLHPGDVSSTLNPDAHGTPVDETPDSPGTYERILLYGYPYLCFIPEVQPSVGNKTSQEPSPEDRQKELDHAVSRGSQLLQGMASNQCLYYSTGWWTYSFCYNAQITQFHALPPGANGKVWPPQEDPTTPSYVLGRFQGPKATGQSAQSGSDRTLSTEVKTQAETNYLVQRLEGGTPCDLTGNDRKVEIQFHCNPQLTDRIGWIKETSTCAYLMIVYTPRLCNDVAFQPPKESQAHPITCREIVSDGDVASWDARHEEENSRQTLDQGQSQQIVLGNIEVGAMKHVGREGKRLERGRIVLSQDEKAETLVMQKNGQISSMSTAELKKLDLSQEDVDAFRKEMQKLAGTKDWKIERIDDVNGHLQFRGFVATDDDDEEQTTKTSTPPEDERGAPGSQEEYEQDV